MAENFIVHDCNAVAVVVIGYDSCFGLITLGLRSSSDNRAVLLSETGSILMNALTNYLCEMASQFSTAVLICRRACFRVATGNTCIGGPPCSSTAGTSLSADAAHVGGTRPG